MNSFVIGDGPPLILLHGVGLDHTMWRPLAGELAGQHKVIAFDLLGHGEAPPLHDPATLAHFTGQLWQEVSAHTTGPVDLCGFSMGAMIAQQAAHERPEAIRNLILMSGVHRRDPAARDAVQTRLNQARNEGTTAIIDAAISRWFTPEFQLASGDTIAAVRDRLERNDPREFLKAYALFAHADQQLADRAAKITCRTLVTTGEFDSGSTPVMMTTLANELPNGQAQLLNGLAHMAPVEAPEFIAKVLAAFLE